MSLVQRIITVAMCVLGTMITRFLPFLVFPVHKETPKIYSIFRKSVTGSFIWTFDHLLFKKS